MSRFLALQKNFLYVFFSVHQNRNEWWSILLSLPFRSRILCGSMYIWELRSNPQIWGHQLVGRGSLQLGENENMSLRQLHGCISVLLFCHFATKWVQLISNQCHWLIKLLWKTYFIPKIRIMTTIFCAVNDIMTPWYVNKTSKAKTGNFCDILK